MTGVPGDYDVDRWIQAFDTDSGTFERLREEVHYALLNAIKDAGVKTHSIVSRVKQRDSFLEKMIRKHYVNPMSEMRDIVGARIVCLFLDDLDKIDAIVRTTFDVVQYDDKAKESPPEMWRYLSVHYDCKIKELNRGPRYDGIKDLTFEVQVRTILQDAWATVEHYLAYKGASSIPTELKRDFSALVGLFHIADKSFQHIYDESIALDQQASQEVFAVTNRPKRTGGAEFAANDIVINRATLKALSHQLYPLRKHAPDGVYSDLVEELSTVGLHHIDELQSLLTKGRDDAEAREALYLQDHSGFDPLSDIGLARLTISMLIPEFLDMQRGRRVRPAIDET
jgi:ppGpp synthetase/RelA/SpoT-type nucleotidyltranferase